MYSYSICEWIVFFCLYCFIGWAGESLYVSWEHKKWVNRGFLKGPFLPIYGSGAIIILFATLPVRNNIPLIFLLGMTSATVLEYLTGYVMEKTFKVRYWDYTIQPFNLNGYICLGCSLTWGLCAELLINFIHKPIERLVKDMTDEAVLVTAIVFSVYFTYDLIVSTSEAFDLRKIIVEAIEKNENIRHMQKRLDVLIAVAADDAHKLKEKLDEKRHESQDEMAKLKAELEAARENFVSKLSAKRRRSAYNILKRNPGATARKHNVNIQSLRELSAKFVKNK